MSTQRSASVSGIARVLLGVVCAVGLFGSAAGTAAALTGPSSTVTAVTSSANPAGPDQQVTYTATVACGLLNGVNPCPGTPTGTVAFLSGTTAITGCGSVTLSGGTAKCTTSYPATGSSQITVHFIPSGITFPASSSPVLTEQVKTGATASTTSLTTSLNPAYPSQLVSYTATVGGGTSGTPAGFVSFMSGTTAIPGCALVALTGGVAHCATSYAATGARQITASYLGDLSFAPSSSGLAQQVSGTPAFAQVTGSPFASGPYPGSVAFSPTGSLIATADGSAGTGMTVFSVAAGGQLTGSPPSFPHSGILDGTGAVAFSPSGGMLAVADLSIDPNGGVEVFTVGSGNQLAFASRSTTLSPQGGEWVPLSVAFNPSGNLLAVLSESGEPSFVGPANIPGLWSEMALTLYNVSPTGVLTGSGATVYSVGFGPGNDDITGGYGIVRSGVTFSPNGSLIAVTNRIGGAQGDNTTDWGGGAVFLFSVGTGGSLTQIGPGADSILPSGLVGGPISQASAGAHLCMLCRDTAGTSIDGLDGPESVAFSPNGALLAVGAGQWYGGPFVNPVTPGPDGRIAIYAVGPKGLTKPAIVTLTGQGDIASLAFSPDGTELAATGTGANDLSVFSVAYTGNPLAPATLTPVTGSPFATGAMPVSVAFSANGQMLTTANLAGSSVSVFKSTSGTLGGLLPSAGKRRCVEPKLIGLTPRQARRRLAKARCGVVVRQVHSPTRRHGHVVGVSGRPGRNYPAGHKVKIYVGS